ncbi:MAG: nucleotidyltransferase domain-containing protein [Candidatus Cloacimonetes bacterium]|nr:nucleotidyltransferase domain-containing protein [Candidatus Cloacimonadota bacterium]
MAQIPNEIRKAVLKFKADIQNDLNIEKVILFGSYVKGKYNDDSDIDVCVIANNITNDYLTLLKIIPKVIDSDVRIEPVVFSKKEYDDPVSYGLLKEIKNYGVEI